MKSLLLAPLQTWTFRGDILSALPAAGIVAGLCPPWCFKHGTLIIPKSRAGARDFSGQWSVASGQLEAVGVSFSTSFDFSTAARCCHHSAGIFNAERQRRGGAEGCGALPRRFWEAGGERRFAPLAPPCIVGLKLRFARRRMTAQGLRPSRRIGKAAPQHGKTRKVIHLLDFLKFP